MKVRLLLYISSVIVLILGATNFRNLPGSRYYSRTSTEFKLASSSWESAQNNSSSSEDKEDPCASKEDPCAGKEDPCAGKEDPCASKEDPCGGKAVDGPPPDDVFFCGQVKGTPTIMARNHWGNVPVIGFKSKAFESDGWSPQKRCEEISTRLDEFHMKGWLKHLSKESLPLRDKSGKKVKVPVICIAAKQRRHIFLPKNEVGLLMTLTKQDDGDAIITALNELSQNPQDGPVEQ